MDEILRELAGDLQMIHQSLERAEAVERQLGRHLREFEEQLKSATARAEAAEALLRGLAAIINPHEPYDATKIAGWARDTVERAREADGAEAHVADLRAALEEVGSRTTGLATVAWNAGQNPKGPWAEREREERVALAKYINAALARTPAQSLAKCKAEALNSIADKIDADRSYTDDTEDGSARACDVKDAIVGGIRDEADRLEKEAANGR